MEKYRFFRKFDRKDLEGRVAGGGHSTTVSRFVPVSSKIDAVSTSFYLTMAVVKLSQCSVSQLGPSNLRMILQQALVRSFHLHSALPVA